MPNFKAHCKSSKERTGKDFAELHKWMDEGQEYLGKDHRFERHSTAYLGYIKEKWKQKGVKEFLLHIIEDYQDTLKKCDARCEDCGVISWGKKRCLDCYKNKKK